MNKNKYIEVKNLVEHFQYEHICGDENSLKRRIFLVATNRPGLELAGYFRHTQAERIVLLGQKEISYCLRYATEQLNDAFDKITSDETPVIIISSNLQCPENLLEIARRKNFPILKSKDKTYHIQLTLTNFLDEHFSPSLILHGQLISINGRGVLIRGESGLGKSEVSLELIRRGHLLVSDDRVDCTCIHSRIIGRSPKITSGLLELRGVGVIDIAAMFGASSIMERIGIDLIIDLETWNIHNDYDRIGIEDTKYEDILGVDIPIIKIPIREGRNMSVIIEAAVTNFILKEKGLNSAKIFEKKVLSFIKSNKEQEK